MILTNFIKKNIQKKEKKKERRTIFVDNAFTAGALQVPTNTLPVSRDDFADNAFAAGGQQVPVIPADIYKYFPCRLTYKESVQDLNSKEQSSSMEETSSSGKSD